MNSASIAAVVNSLKMASLPMTIISTISHLPAAHVTISLICGWASMRIVSSMCTPRMSLSLCDATAEPTCLRVEQSVA